jgi:quinol monooxygenase YgiN
MNAVIVRYELDPDRLDEHLALISDVFDHLRTTSPPGIHYGVTRSVDDTTFTHIGIYEDDDARAVASGSDAFQAFVAEIAERCNVPPHAVEQTVVEGYEVFGR